MVYIQDLPKQTGQNPSSGKDRGPNISATGNKFQVKKVHVCSISSSQTNSSDFHTMLIMIGYFTIQQNTVFAIGLLPGIIFILLGIKYRPKREFPAETWTLSPLWRSPHKSFYQALIRNVKWCMCQMIHSRRIF